MVGRLSDSCARAASGHATAALPRSAMKLRRLMRQSLPKGSVVRHSKIASPMTLWVNRSTSPPSIPSGHVRYISESDRMGASQRTIEKCHEGQ